MARAAMSATVKTERCDRDVTTPSDDRSQTAKAYQWASRIMVVSLEMVLPGLAGNWVDTRLGTKILFTLLGFAAGSTAAVMHLIRMTRADENRNGSD
jgi:Putative F0F1-ATPase subunit Ca2+/Mg2+ transporter